MSEIATGTTSLLRASLSRTGKWAASFAFVSGAIGDVLNPLGPFAAYIALGAAVAALIIAIAMVLRLVLAAKAMPALIFATSAAAIAGGVYGIQQQTNSQNGVIAGLVPAVAELQQSLGIVSQKVAKIEKTVTETQKTVEAVKKSTDTVAKTTEEIALTQTRQTQQGTETQKTVDAVKQTTDTLAAGQQRQQAQVEKLQATTEQIAASIDTIAKGFAQLAAQGGTIADPKRPDEFYHNARVYELAGDMLNARRSYLAFAGFDVDAIDPYTRFATLLRVQDGKASAREVFGQLAEKAKAPSLKLVHLLQFDDAQRLDKLNAFIAANPDYAPAYFLLAQEFSEDRLGSQTLADKRSEATALTKFVSYEKDGGLLKYFVDQTQLADWLDRSRTRLTALGDVLDPSRFVPTLTPTRSNAGWSMTISLPEPATAISWRFGDNGPFTDTGMLAMNDQRTGKPMPNPSFELPDSTAATNIGIKYLDIRGRETGPFDIRFDPDSALQQGNKQILDQFWTSWIAFDAGGNRGLVYFTQMLSFRCAIRQVHYSLNGTALDKEIKMPPCDAKDPYAIPSDYQPYFKVKDDVKSMAVQVTYTDGTKSPVREYKRQ
ncbi:methyl-accepting chemotaxis protein [Mesorhizobium sp. CA18]|uniref:tetratricopeptide repeat protein n=1 Tax=unclassified Mesorhizobium TaxID=325217 RepID=UPI001CCA28E2|nr:MULTISPECIES: methyl-accepting chemotaxis protein [unclassified Mesorhizobium]MBZ9735330.1 methyl-accepting chemotaxis protein [Mesorhizobium sp. CA9]MBZ9825673.1 methyl-accepting chemotaxis protein [Mesorhizobium sp. CA18]MBZ9831767.1 methyl-accepting chemotaxis protein [Mesorhizobium sp. CA2]MBZ9839116.1 methyl-accepting chemotaxis protein [Mesorhizobium sp. CA3]MBZ9878720.1 methyl-accepting chemotaxis protein [Mesorhizobium sp. Ca11]